jgi:hypothetical protein
MQKIIWTNKAQLAGLYDRFKKRVLLCKGLGLLIYYIPAAEYLCLH